MMQMGVDYASDDNRAIAIELLRSASIQKGAKGTEQIRSEREGEIRRISVIFEDRRI